MLFVRYKLKHLLAVMIINYMVVAFYYAAIVHIFFMALVMYALAFNQHFGANSAIPLFDRSPSFFVNTNALRKCKMCYTHISLGYANFPP